VKGTCNVRSLWSVRFLDIMMLPNCIVLIDGMRFILLKMVGRLWATKCTYIILIVCKILTFEIGRVASFAKNASGWIIQNSNVYFMYFLKKIILAFWVFWEFKHLFNPTKNILKLTWFYFGIFSLGNWIFSNVICLLLLLSDKLFRIIHFILISAKQHNMQVIFNPESL